MSKGQDKVTSISTKDCDISSPAPESASSSVSGSSSNKVPSATDSTTTMEASDATASSTASTTSEERSAVDVEVERYLPFQSTQQQILVLTQLAKQLEYYFSQKNLANDTYLQTLRDLNDGCAPVSILANFTNVKRLLPGVLDDDVRIHAILQAATEYSDLLRVLSIDTSTGSVATDLTPSSAKTILAVGPVGQEPLSISAASPSVATASTRTSTWAAPSSLQQPLPSTVILRDVLPDVTPEQVRELFEQLQDCPTVTNIHMDVGCCCFVKLDSTSQQDMLRVVMQLRSSTLAGHPVHARLKSSTAAPVDSLPWTSQAGARPFEPFDVSTVAAASLPKKKKTRSRGKRKKKTTVLSADGAEVKVTPVESVAEHSVAPPIEATLSLGEDDFPTLLDNHVEWETPLEEQEDVHDVEEEESASKSSLRNLSDVASTATTTSTSSSSLDKQRTKVGYAAALRKAIADPDVAVAVAAPSSSKMNAVSKEFVMPPTGKRKEETSADPVATAVLPVAKPAQWGGTRSFVDVLRTSQ